MSRFTFLLHIHIETVKKDFPRVKMRDALLAKAGRQTEFYHEGGPLPSLAILNAPMIGNNVLIISWFVAS